ncbi:MAG: rubrerythrin family protein [Clostridiales bacterium]|nr:rubrerythrin family protein [Clostridiales bacterium]
MLQALKGTQTEENLMRAFAGESQARNRYTFAAQKAKQNQLHVVEAVFMFTANQEKEHGEIFYDYLKYSAGSTIFIDGGYPVDLYDDAYSLLKAAEHNEYEEYGDVYKNFGDTAEQEGFTQIANTFRNIARIEKTHGDRFGYYAELIKENKLFVSDISTGFICLNCGHVYTGTNAPKQCPVCKHDQGYFIRADFMPYGKF